MNKFFTLLTALVVTAGAVNAQTAVPMSSQGGLTYTENFSDIANWGANFASGTGASAWKSVAINATGTIPDGVRTTVSSATFSINSAGGVQKGTLNMLFLSTGTTDNSNSTAAEFFMDFTGVNAGTLSFDYAQVANGSGDRKSSLKVYTSTDGTTYTELVAAAVLNITNNVVSSGSITTVALPASFNNTNNCRLRFYEYNATGGTTGSRAKISIDNLTVTATAILPISLVNFTADKLSEKVKISWTTATEINNDMFMVQRSSDGENFETIAEVRGAGNSREINNYSIVDAEPLKGTSYYRLRQYDFDGKSETFAPVAVRMDAGSLKLEAVSSKLDAGSVEMSIYSPIATATSIRVMDLSGRIIASENIYLVEGYQTVNINANALSSGIHIIQLMSGEEVVMKKLVL